MKRNIIYGKSALNNNLIAQLYFKNRKKQNLPLVLILATVHGDEIEGLWLAEHFETPWRIRFPYANINVLLVPRTNPDGLALGQRTNGKGVDLNRNLPTLDWNAEAFNKRYPPGPFAGSEPENQGLIYLINNYKPKAILTLHSFKEPQINANGKDETGVIDLANALFEVSPYKKITRGDEMGYPTPGCLGTYAGYERDIPTITYELLRGSDIYEILNGNIPVVEKFIEFFNEKKLKK
ncbi:MAG: DUF2817 domain-containing protein [Candidatus Nomurabacteria bacterium]|nr:DUF2817 domain-containing protein [Candidatus Nomurabacteria bacterium]